MVEVGRNLWNSPLQNQLSRAMSRQVLSRSTDGEQSYFRCPRFGGLGAVLPVPTSPCHLIRAQGRVQSATQRGNRGTGKGQELSVSPRGAVAELGCILHFLRAWHHGLGQLRHGGGIQFWRELLEKVLIRRSVGTPSAFDGICPLN